MRKLSYFLFLVCLHSPTDFAEAGVLSKCSEFLTSALSRVFVSHERADKLTETVQMIWYPHTEFVSISHIELSVDGQMWDATAGFTEKGTIVARERAAKAGKRGFFSFSLKLTPAEKERMQKYIEANTRNLQFQLCVSGACRALRKSQGLSIPFPFSQVPTLAVIYLSLNKIIGNRRIERIDYVGKSRLLNLLSPALLGEGVFTYQVGKFGFGVIVWFTNETGELINQLVPIIIGKAEIKSDKMVTIT